MNRCANCGKESLTDHECKIETRGSAPLQSGVMAKTKNIERVIGRFYIEARKLENAGCPNSYGETDWYYDRMKVLADKLIETEEP